MTDIYIHLIPESSPTLNYKYTVTIQVSDQLELFRSRVESVYDFNLSKSRIEELGHKTQNRYFHSIA